MKFRFVSCVVLLVSVATLAADVLVRQQEVKPAKPEQETGRGQQDPDSLVETWVANAMPGEHHKLLEKMAGKWDMKIKYRMRADTPVVESAGTCERKLILGDRFVLEEFDGGFLAVPFQGLAIYGYDAFEKKYTSVWIDTTSTAITTSLGICQEPCDRVDFRGRHGDPWTGVMKKSRGVTRFISDTKHTLELYEPDDTGQEFRVLEIVYTRQKAGSSEGG